MATDSTADKERSNSVRLLHMGAPGRTKGPRLKKGGISVPIHLWNAVELLSTLRTDAYKRMGGETQQSLSDEVELAFEVYLAHIQKQYGPFPVTTAERETYIEKLQKSMEQDAIDDIRGNRAKAS